MIAKIAPIEAVQKHAPLRQAVLLPPTMVTKIWSTSKLDGEIIIYPQSLDQMLFSILVPKFKNFIKNKVLFVTYWRELK